MSQCKQRFPKQGLYKNHVWSRMNHARPDMCQIYVKPKQTGTRDTWVFSSGLIKECGGRSKTWGVCMNRMTYLCLGYPTGGCRYRTEECKCCTNDYFDALVICHAEKGTKIILYDDGDSDYKVVSRLNICYWQRPIEQIYWKKSQLNKELLNNRQLNFWTNNELNNPLLNRWN